MIHNMNSELLFDHVTGKLSNLDMEMVRAIPPGGNWKNIPPRTVRKSKRLQQIHASGGRSTYYGRLQLGRPSYTISTFFSRPGNGCYIHPKQDRLISFREAARLQSFPDSFRFTGSRTSKYKQIGNAVPPLMAKAVASAFTGRTAIDLFAGAGGLSWGLHQAGFECLVAVDSQPHMCDTLRTNGCAREILNLDMTEDGAIQKVCKTTEDLLRGRQLDLCAGGPPCQGFSTAGNWDQTDSRNNLFKPFLEIVRALEPVNVLLENVPGIRSMLKGAVLREIMATLSGLGYNVRWTTLKSESFGVPQKRRRVFVFATLEERNMPFPDTYFASSNDDKTRLNTEGEVEVLPDPLTVGDAISELPPIGQGGGDDIIDYDSNWPESEYQKWLREQISFRAMYKSYADGAENL